MQHLRDYLPRDGEPTEVADRLIEIVQAIVLVLDRDARVLFYNPYFEQLSGIPLNEARGTDWFTTFLPSRDRGRIRALFERALVGEPVVDNVNPIVSASGEEREIEWSGTLLGDGDGRTTGVLSVGIDITERRRLRQELTERERLATIGATASMFAHEVGNPLNNMILHGHLLQRRLRATDADESLLGPLGNLLDEVKRLRALLDEFRGLSQRTKLEFAPTNLGSLVEDVVRVHVAPQRLQTIRVERQLPRELPTVPASADKLKQVLLNLCKNAIEAMPDGGVLRIEAEFTDDDVILRVKDTGVGVPNDIDAFQPFESTKPNGTGLGLPIAREILRAHGGELTYSNNAGDGTTFVMRLPRTTRRSSAPPA